jgi:hypothetical protein
VFQCKAGIRALSGRHPACLYRIPLHWVCVGISVRQLVELLCYCGGDKTAAAQNNSTRESWTYAREY